MAMVDVVPSSL